jgi:hypothetical protein
MSKRIGFAVIMVLGLLLVFLLASSLPALAGEDAGGAAFTTAVDAAEAAQAPPLRTVEASMGQIPLYFIENQGQIDGPVAYYVQGKDKTLYFTPQGVTFVLAGTLAPLDRGLDNRRAERPAYESSRWVLKLDFVGADPEARPLGEDETGAVISYFKGRPEEWKTGLKTYSAVVYRDLWPGIDLEYSGTVDRLKYQFVVHPGADPSQVRLSYRGARVTINEAGQLEVSTPEGGFQDGTPYAYQLDESGERVEVDVSYDFGRAARERDVYGFRVGPYDDTRTLVLDPSILVYCGYIGGSAIDDGSGVAVDHMGFAYVTGSTLSGEATFPETVGPDLFHNSAYDAFVAKVAPDGSYLVYCGYIGGSQDDIGWDVAVDGSAQAYVVGRAASSESQAFPVSVGPDVTHNGDWDAFVAKVSSDGTWLVYCGYIGGSSLEAGYGGAVDGSGRVYVTGETFSSQATFPDGDGFGTLSGPDTTYNLAGDTFVARVKADGSALEYCGYVGGSDGDHGNAIAVDGSGSAYVIGSTQSDHAEGFPLTAGPDSTFNGGGRDAFVAKVRADGTGFGYSGYIGGSDWDEGWGIAVDSSGNAYVTGYTLSDEASFPVVLGPDLTHNGNEDAFVARVRAGGVSLDYCGYIGGASGDAGYDIAVDGAGNAYVCGYTTSSEASFPVVGGPFTYYLGSGDAFVAKVRPFDTALDYCGYIGGSAEDRAYGIAVDPANGVYITGWTESDESAFPVTAGPDTEYNGDRDAFVAKIVAPELRVTKALEEPPGGLAVVSDTISYQIRIANSGATRITSIPLWDYYCPSCLQLTSSTIDPIQVDNVLGVAQWPNVLDPALGGPGQLLPGEEIDLLLYYHADVLDTMYWKEGGWIDYAPKGMPDFDQKQADWWEDLGYGPFWYYCGPVAAANSLWWFDSKFEPYPVPPPAHNDGYTLVQSAAPWEHDDHDPQNVAPLVSNLAGRMGTTPDWGTHVYDLTDGLSGYIADQGLADGYTVELVPEPEFGWVEEEVRRSEDVILLLGFWQDVDGHMRRVGGHYVTVAGIDSLYSQIAFSDPYRDWAEAGYAGRLLPHPHGPSHLTEFHNRASFASHDVYVTDDSPSPGGLWGPVEYAVECDQILNFQWQNEGDHPNEEWCEPGWEIFTEVEYAVAVSPITPTILCKPTDNIAVAGPVYDEYGLLVPEAQGHAQVRVNKAPVLGAIFPAGGSGPTGSVTYFETSWADANGQADLKHCYFHIGASPSLLNNVTLMYNAVKNKLWLRDDSGSTWTGGCAPGSATVMENSQALVYCSMTSAYSSAETLYVNWAIEFKPGYTGAKKTGLKCKDRDKARAKGKWKGTWTIAPSAIPTPTPTPSP